MIVIISTKEIWDKVKLKLSSDAVFVKESTHNAYNLVKIENDYNLVKGNFATYKCDNVILSLFDARDVFKQHMNIDEIDNVQHFTH